MALAFVLRSLAASLLPCTAFPSLPCVAAWWNYHVPFPYSDVSVIAFTLGALLWIPLNKGVLIWIGTLRKLDSWKPFGLSIKQILVTGWPYKAEGDRVIAEDGDPLNMLLRRADANQKTLLVTLKGGKVYVGFLSSTSPPGTPARSVGLLPTRSGYRHPITKEVEYTINYADALSTINLEIDLHETRLDNISRKIAEVEVALARKKSATEISEIKSRIVRLERRKAATERRIERRKAIILDFRIVIPIEEIASIAIYREDVWERYFDNA
ncbi:MAG: hypothetical protein QOH70_1124 [Blastocatellia bacterium]|nr:hypothetical protein [Blastocatellia bacterium]